MKTVQVMLPVLIMIVMGAVFHKTEFISEKGMDDIKKYITKIALPVTIFHAMAIATMNRDMAMIILVMFLMLSVAMILGFLLRPFMKEPYKNYLPFMITVFEGGMFSYPLYQNLCGDTYFVNIVIVDIAGCIFGFGIFCGILAMVDQKLKFSVKTMAKTAFTSPTFLAVVFGLFMNLTGLMKILLDSPIGNLYLPVKEIITAPLTAMILLVVGYSIKLDKSLFVVCIKTVVMRCIVMALLGFATIMVLKNSIQDVYMLTAFLIMFITTPTFSAPGFVKNKEAASYFAMTTSIFVFVTIIGYAVISLVLFS